MSKILFYVLLGILSFPVVRKYINIRTCISCERSILKQAQNQSISLPQDFWTKLDEYVHQTCYELSGGHTFRIVWYKNLDQHNRPAINAHAIVGFNRIEIATKWAEFLVLQNSEDTIETFRDTIGHEITHHELDGEINKKYPLSMTPLGEFIPNIRKRTQFICYCKEVHADYGGCMKALGGDLTKAANCVHYKLQTLSDEDTISHPSFTHRLHYLEIGKFDEAMIDRIATDLGYKDDAVIAYIKDVYKVDFEKMILHITTPFDVFN